jgi:hypothetical protein
MRSKRSGWARYGKGMQIQMAVRWAGIAGGEEENFLKQDESCVAHVGCVVGSEGSVELSCLIQISARGSQWCLDFG